MHIPDGYLSPQTCAVMGAAALPVWIAAAQKIKKSLQTRFVPLMAVGAAFSFVIMMYNVPIPDGTTAHAVGGALLAIVLGPWGACLAISVALLIQALLFGDGGIWAFGANAFNMAFILPFSSFYIYSLIAGKSPASSFRRWLGGFVAGYAGLNLAALAAAVEFGLQPVFFHTPAGAPLYCPYPLNLAVPAMAFAHLAIAGPIEGIITALAVRYLQAASPSLLTPETSTGPKADLKPGIISRFWWGIVILILLAPVGLLAQGTAWGEWGMDELKELLGFVPPGLEKLSEWWSAPLPDYSLPGAAEGGFAASALWYIVSAVIGVIIIGGISYLFSKAARSRKKGETTSI